MDDFNKRDIPQKCRKAYDRAMTGRSQSAAIRSFCLECVGYDREEVKACTDPACPLYAYRITGRKVPPNGTTPPHRAPATRFGVRETAVESTI